MKQLARHLALGGVLALLAVVGPSGQVTHAAQPSVPIIRSDYPPAEWVPANPANFTVSNRPQRYQVNFIVIHDIEGSVDDAIAAFQDPNRGGSAHYIVGQAGGVWQMVLEKDIAWHAGNWDYNTRAIGIEHEGFACCAYYTTAEYDTSARLAASICSRWGVPLDRSHVIGHSEVPDPNNPGLFGGEDHHTDPGPYWDWSYYMSLSQSYASSLPSPPHMGPNPIAKSEEGSVWLSWQPAQSCRLPITGYQIVGQPGNITMSVPANQTSAWITGLTDGTSYSFTVTASNPDGQSSLTSNAAVPGQACSSTQLATSVSSPQLVGTSITVTATSAGCNTPEYAFWLRTPDGTWTKQQFYSSSATWTWNTAGLGQGTYQLGVWARQANDGHDYDEYAIRTFTVAGATCQSGSLTPSAAPPQPPGTVVTFTASSTGCAAPQYQFWLLPPGGQWTVVQPYSTATTWSFNSSQYPVGNFQVGIWVRQTSSTNAYDAFYVTTYWIRDAGGCVTSGLSPSAAQPQAVGAQLTFTPQQAGCIGQYRFWMLPPGGQWTIVQDFGSASTWSWNTAGFEPGVYEVGVWERNAGSSNSYDSYAITTFTLGVATCGSASLTSNVASPQAPGTSVNFTAASTGCAAPSYEFWLWAPGGSWTIQRPYGSATWTWNTSGLSPRTYQVGVWVRQAGSTAAYDAWYITTYEVGGPSCAAASLTASPASPQNAGTPITFTASSTGCSTSPWYEFVVQAPGGPWSIAQGFSPQATFTWNTSAAARGSYNVAVWAVASGSPADFDAYSITPYAIS